MRHNRQVPGRRLILLLVLLLVTLSVVSASRDVSRRPPAAPGKRTDAAGRPATTDGRLDRAQPAPGGTPARATLPSRTPVRARPGDRVILKVRSAGPDVVLIERLGLRAPVGPGTDGVLDFVVAERGSFPVSLALEAKPIGDVVVSD